MEKALEENKKDKTYLQWLVQIPNMDKFVPFEDYYNNISGKNIDYTPTDVALKEIEAIENKMKGDNKNGN